MPRTMPVRALALLGATILLSSAGPTTVVRPTPFDDTNVRPDQHRSGFTSVGGQSNAFTDEDTTVCVARHQAEVRRGAPRIGNAFDPIERGAITQRGDGADTGCA